MLLADEVRGTVENSESECSSCRKLPCDGKGLGEKLDLETSETAVVCSDTNELGPAVFGLLP